MQTKWGFILALRCDPCWLRSGSCWLLPLLHLDGKSNELCSKDRQHKEDKRTGNSSTTDKHKAKDRVTRIPHSQVPFGDFNSYAWLYINAWASMKINNVTTRKYYATILFKDCMSLILQVKYFHVACTSWDKLKWNIHNKTIIYIYISI
jgi:hypothetical protein